VNAALVAVQKGRPQLGGGGGVFQCKQWGGCSSDADARIIFGANNSDFSKFMACPNTGKG